MFLSFLRTLEHSFLKNRMADIPSQGTEDSYLEVMPAIYFAVSSRCAQLVNLR